MKKGRVDHTRRPPKITKRFRLNAGMCLIVSKSEDPIVLKVRSALEEFEYSEVVGARYTWKYLPDDAFQELCSQLTPDTTKPFDINHVVLSHLLRIIEAYEIVSIWRAREIVGTCVKNLNDGQMISAATLARSLIELTVSYGEAVNLLRHKFEHFAWNKLHTHVLGLDQTDEVGRRVGLEGFIERLMFGTRLPQRLAVMPGMEQKNILTILDGFDKKSQKQIMGYTIRPHYDFLSEIVHPNTLGYARFSSTAKIRSDGWIEQLMEERASSQFATKIAGECLWSLSFATGSLNGLFGEFQTLIESLKQHLGSILPQPLDTGSGDRFR